MFIQDIALAELIFAKYSKRDLAKNFLVKKYLNENEYDTSVIQDILRPHYSSRQGLNKALKQINTLAQLGTDTVADVLDEIRLKLVA